MTKEWVFNMIKRNRHKRQFVITYIADFLATTREIATKIYDTEYKQWESDLT